MIICIKLLDLQFKKKILAWPSENPILGQPIQVTKIYF